MNDAPSAARPSIVPEKWQIGAAASASLSRESGIGDREGERRQPGDLLPFPIPDPRFPMADERLDRLPLAARLPRSAPLKVVHPCRRTLQDCPCLGSPDRSGFFISLHYRGGAGLKRQKLSCRHLPCRKGTLGLSTCPASPRAQIRKVQVESVVQLLDEGNTIPLSCTLPQGTYRRRPR